MGMRARITRTSHVVDLLSKPLYPSASSLDRLLKDRKITRKVVASSAENEGF